MTRRALHFAAAALMMTCWIARGESGFSIPAWVETERPAAHPTFEVSLNGKPAEINTALGPSSDQVILLVMDVSGDPAYVDPARQALASVIGKLPRNIWVGLLKAQDGLHVLADPGPDRGPVIEQIQSLANSGTPGLLETVRSALGLADDMIRKAPVRVSVLYITDSNIYNYREDFTNPIINQSDPHDLSRKFPEALIAEKISKLMDAAGPLQAPLFIIHVHNRSDRLNRAYENGLESLAEITGGRTELCRSVAEIPEAISAAFERITSGWQLTVAVPPKVRGVAQVRLSGHSGDEELRLSWRTHLEAKERQKNAANSHAHRSGPGL